MGVLEHYTCVTRKTIEPRTAFAYKFDFRENVCCGAVISRHPAPGTAIVLCCQSHWIYSQRPWDYEAHTICTFYIVQCTCRWQRCIFFKNSKCIYKFHFSQSQNALPNGKQKKNQIEPEQQQNNSRLNIVARICWCCCFHSQVQQFVYTHTIKHGSARHGTMSAKQEWTKKKKLSKKSDHREFRCCCFGVQSENTYRDRNQCVSAWACENRTQSDKRK